MVNDADPQQTVLDNFWEEYPALKREEVRSALGSFLFSQEEVEKKMGQLSGGEKVRLALCKMFQTRPNLLILDEPTNHMDIVGKQALEQMLQNFRGTVLFVSHDRYFIRQVATEILEFLGESVKQYHCGYEEYLQERQRFVGADKNGLRKGGAGQEKNGTAQSSLGASQKRTEAAGGSGEMLQDMGKVGHGTFKEPTLRDVFDKKAYYNPGKIKSRLTKQLEKYEAQLAESEEKAAALQLQLMDPALASDYEKLMELQASLQEEEHKQETLLERMLETETELEELELS